jgi:hypothetical protein
VEKVRGNLWIRRLYVRHMLLYLHLPAWFEIVFPPAEAVQRPLHVHQSHHHFTRQYYAVFVVHPMARGHQKSIPVPPTSSLQSNQTSKVSVKSNETGYTEFVLGGSEYIYSSENENTLLKNYFRRCFIHRQLHQDPSLMALANIYSLWKLNLFLYVNSPASIFRGHW